MTVGSNGDFLKMEPVTTSSQALVTAYEKTGAAKVAMVRKSTGEAYAQIRAEAGSPKVDLWWGGTGDPHLQAALEERRAEFQAAFGTHPELRAALPDWDDATFQAYTKRHYPAYWLKVDVDRKARHAEMLRALDDADAPLATDVRLDPERGVVELTVALHHVFETPTDRLIWDVGHQCYPHKILTGRRELMHTIRQKDGLSGFTLRTESDYDPFGAGHSSTSISAGLGTTSGVLASVGGVPIKFRGETIDVSRSHHSYVESEPVGVVACIVPWNVPIVLAVSKAAPAWSRQIEAESYSAMAGVQLEACSEGGQDVGWIDTNDWMAYNSISFPTSGTYKVEYRVASAGGGRLSLDLNAGSIQLGQLAVPATGGWQNWTTISHTVNINAGTYNVGVFAQQGGWNLNWIKFTKL